jgi:hypothetical protein
LKDFFDLSIREAFMKLVHGEASHLFEATPREGKTLMNPAAHVDSVDATRPASTLPTIAWTGLRPDHRIHKPAATIFSAGQRPGRNFGRSSLLNFKSPENGSLLIFK